MKKIVGVFNLSSIEFETFNKNLNKTILDLQADGQEVEVQYSTNVMNGGIRYSALILGRTNVENKERNIND